MIGAWRGRVVVALVVLGTVVAVIFLLRFPWGGAADAVRRADGWILLAAGIVNVASFAAKGLEWQLLLGLTARSRWKVTQEATLLGAAVASVSSSLAGEAARIHHVVARDHVPPGVATASVAWARIVEALGLALLVIVASPFLRLPPPLRGLQFGAGVTAVIILGLALSGPRRRLINLLPERARAAATSWSRMGAVGRLPAPTLCALLNWITQWATFHLTFVALHIRVPLEASLIALLITNLSGILRISPGNIGLMEASMPISLYPFGVPPGVAIVAGLALHALQVLPILAIAIAVFGWKGIRTAFGGGRRSRPGVPRHERLTARDAAG